MPSTIDVEQCSCKINATPCLACTKKLMDVVLSAQDSKLMADTLSNPPEPNKALIDLFKKPPGGK